VAVGVVVEEGETEVLLSQKQRSITSDLLQMVYLGILADRVGGTPTRTVHLAGCMWDTSARTVDLGDRSHASFNRTDYLADLQGRQLHRTGYLADCHLVLCLGTVPAR
jgi:hypothetical protein